MQLPRCDGRAHNIVTSLGNNGWDIADLIDVTQKLPFLKEPMIDEIVVLDACEGEGEPLIFMGVGGLFVQVGRRSFPHAPRPGGSDSCVMVVRPQQFMVDVDEVDIG